MPVSAGLLVAAISSVCPIPVPDVRLSLPNGDAWSPAGYANRRPLALVFLGVDCPLANSYAPHLRDLSARLEKIGVPLVAVMPNRFDDPESVAAFAQKHRLAFPCVLDPDQRLTIAVGVRRTPEAAVVDAGRRVRYRGRIDDRYQAGGKDRGRPTREDLFAAATEVAQGNRVSVPVTAVTGCLIDRNAAVKQAEPPVTYAQGVAPILRTHCQVCHRPGQIGPFPLLTFADARRHAATIAEVVAEGRMPPWHASPAHGKFKNDRSLSAAQKRTIARWVELGCPEGEREQQPAVSVAAGGWEMGTPDVIIPIPVEFEVPEQGLVDYQHFHVETEFTEDVWVQAAEVRPGNRRVVHHCNVFLQPPDSTDREELFNTGNLRSANLIAWAPGGGPMRLPPGMAKLIPRGFRLHFIVHYTTVGTRQFDRTEVGLKLIPVGRVRKEVATRLLDDPTLVIPPHARNHRVERTWRADREYLLLAMFPHMHLRGKSFRYEAEFPDGSRDLLLDVPAYDVNWQHRYELAEPRHLPAGTVIRCTAVYDNSADNPANPDPDATVREGLQTTDEMFNGFFDITLADQDIAGELECAAAADGRRRRALSFGAAAAVVAVFWAVRLVRRS